MLGAQANGTFNDRGHTLPALFISHSSRDDLAAEAIRVHLVSRGWNRQDIFVDFNDEGILAHERWKASLAHANARANALLCLVSPDWLASKECQVERRVAESLKELDPWATRAILTAILRDATVADLVAMGFGEEQIVDLSASGESVLVRAKVQGRDGQAGRTDDVKFNILALEKIERSLRLVGVAPESFDWIPRDSVRPSPYPGLEVFTENEAGVFFGREAKLAQALEMIDNLRRHNGSRILSIIAASGVGKSSFLRAGLWPRLARQSGVAPLVILRPGAGILSGRDGGLIYALSDWFRRAGRSVDPGDIRAWFAGRTTREGLAAALLEATRVATERRLLILGIDQAEELFDATDASKADEARRFLQGLLALMAEPVAGADCLVILTIRADSYDLLAAALAHAAGDRESAGTAGVAALHETSLTLAPLAPTAYRDVIRRPAQVARKTDREVFEPALVEHLVETFTGADALPLLAMTLEQLFSEYASRKQITRVDYEALYGQHRDAEGPVTRALAEAYRLAEAAGTDETLKRLLIPALATWDPRAGESGAAKRRIALRVKLLRDDANLSRLADTLAAPTVRLLTRGTSQSGPTLEIAHEALLRVQRIKRWIEGYAAELRLRDEVEREASEWRSAEQMLADARSRADDVGGAKRLMDSQRAVDAAIAARRGPRLEAAKELLSNPAFADQMHDDERAYLAACDARETQDRNRLVRVIGRAFVQPALQALEEARPERALRLAAAGALLAKDLDLAVVRELWQPAVQAVSASRTWAVLRGHSRPVRDAGFSQNGMWVVTASDDNTARVWDAESGTEIALLKGHMGTVLSAMFSPDGKRVVTASEDATARIWGAERGAEIALLKAHEWSVLSAAFSPDGKRVVTASEDATARIWDAESGTEIALLKAHEWSMLSAAFSPDGKRVVTASADFAARIWDAESGARIALLIGHDGIVRNATFSPDGKRVVTASDDHTARIWDAQRGTEIAVLKAHEWSVLSAAFSRDSKRVLTASEDHTARIWDAETGAEIALLKAHDGVVRSAKFSPDGKRVVSASDDGTARIWDAESGREIVLLKSHERRVWSAAFSPDGKRVVTASDDDTARIWGAESGIEIACLEGHDDRVRNAKFSPDGKVVVTASDDSTARIWDAETDAEIGLFIGHEHWVLSVAFSPDGKRVVTASEDNTAQIWDAESGTEIVVLKGHVGSVWSATFSLDGKRVVTASEDNTAQIWDAESGTEVAFLKAHERRVWSVAFSPDGKRVVTASSDNTARIWDAESGTEIARLEGHDDRVWSAAFSPDGKRVVTASDDHTARIWDAESGTEIACLEGHDDRVWSAAFSPDGKLVVTASDDNTARICDVESGTEVALLKGHRDNVLSAVFSADGRRVVTASSDNTARIWDAESGTEIARLEGHQDDVLSAAFSADGKRVVTASDDYTARIWDVSRTQTIVRERAVVLTAAIACGVGWRTATERRDLLMQDAPEDLFAEAMAQLGDRPGAVAEMATKLRAPLHENCYLSPTQFAKMFDLTQAG